MDRRCQRRAVVFCALFLACVAGVPLSGKEPALPGVAKESLEAAYGPRRLALVVGINEFQDPAWRGLHYAVKDAQDMAAALRDPEAGYFDQVIELTRPWETTRESILEALRQLANRNMSPDDVVLVYISTHGTLARDANNQLHQYLVTCDTSFDAIPSTALDIDQLDRTFNSLTSKRKVLIIAACHSGQGKSELPPDLQGELGRMKSGFFVEPIEAASEASVIIGASSWGETALEDPKLANDIYTHFFIEGMKTYDRNQDGAVSISEAHDYAQRQTYYYTQGKQRPFARSDILGSDPIILTGKVSREGMPVVLSYSEGLDGSIIYINGREKGSLPDGFTTEQGWNRIRAVSPSSDRSLYQGMIYVRQGERVDIDRLVELRHEPNLGLVTSYRFLASRELSEKVVPGLPMYGLAYRIGAFPTSHTSIMIEASYGRTDWTADLERRTKVSVQAVEANAALLFSRRSNRADFFAGPLVGVFGMTKDIQVPGDSDRRNSGTVYPGVIGGMRLLFSRDLNLELSDRVGYHNFNVDGTMKGTLVNEVSATLYFQPRTMAGLFK